MYKICTPQLCGGLNILNLELHILARKTSLLPKFAEKTIPWARMLSDVFDNFKTKSFGSWDTKHWDIVLGNLDRHIKGCSFISKLLKH